MISLPCRSWSATARLLAPRAPHHHARLPRAALIAAQASTLSQAIPTPADTVKAAVFPNGLGVITLDRPKALNAMDADMTGAMLSVMNDWKQGGGVKAIMVEGSTPRAYCSGGDVKAIRAMVLEDPYAETPPPSHDVSRVFQNEYQLVLAVGDTCPVPYISICDGVTMGFGVGISGHGSIMVVTEKTLFAMPENAIGLWPDIGFALLAARAPGALGLFLALTGERLATPSDLAYAGISTHYVPSEKVPALRARLSEAAFPAPSGSPVRRGEGAVPPEVLAVLGEFAEEPSSAGEARLAALQPAIDRCFGGGGLDASGGPGGAPAAVGAIMKALEEETEEREWAQKSLEAMRRDSPLSLCVAQAHFAAVSAAVRGGGGALASLPGVMQTEYSVAVRMVRTPNFLEGVRAALVDKDRSPKWEPAEVGGVAAGRVGELFAGTPASEGLKMT